MDCVTPALLTDGQFGADNYSSTENYYIAQHGDSYQILFTFPTIKVVRYIMLYYYNNVTGNKSLPRVSVYIVNDDFNVWDSPTTSWIVEVGPSNLPPTQAGLKQERITVDSASRKWLLRFRQLEHQFYLSEVAFFSCLPGMHASGFLYINYPPPINYYIVINVLASDSIQFIYSVKYKISIGCIMNEIDYYFLIPICFSFCYCLNIFYRPYIYIL
jgi:hypothetical protein